MVFGRHCVAITIHNSKGLILSPQPKLSEGVDLTGIANLVLSPFRALGLEACRCFQYLPWMASSAKL